MSQKDYNMEIVLDLLKNSNHIRGLAKQLATNQTTIARKVKELETLNIVDYREEGKNKVYFLKKTIEAEEFVYIGEHNKLIQVLHQFPILRQIVSKIKENSQIKLAILFGSYAKGISKTSSDIDIYIETTNRTIKKELEGLNSKLSIKIGEFNKDNLLIKEIIKNHIVIKGVENYYSKIGLFN